MAEDSCGVDLGLGYVASVGVEDEGEGVGIAFGLHVEAVALAGDSCGCDHPCILGGRDAG